MQLPERNCFFPLSPQARCQRVCKLTQAKTSNSTSNSTSNPTSNPTSDGISRPWRMNRCSCHNKTSPTSIRQRIYLLSWQVPQCCTLTGLHLRSARSTSPKDVRCLRAYSLGNVVGAASMTRRCAQCPVKTRVPCAKRGLISFPTRHSL